MDLDMLFSTVLGDLAGRLITFLIRKYQEPGAAADLARLQRALLRARAVIEEADARQVTNRAMLQQLKQLRTEMCRASYLLDATASRSLVSPPPVRNGVVDGPSVVAESLEAALGDMREFLVLLGGCPRLNRQPYSAYLFMENCMFGRQMEKEQIIGFLLQPAEGLDVLPIIGAPEVGKRTLVEHVCLDERVREHFASIHRLSSDDLDQHHHGLIIIDTTARYLFLIDLTDGDADEEERWRGFHSSVRRRARGGGKVILISRAEKHSGLGTVPPLRLRALGAEELWYFFRALAFGAADPEGRPDLLRVAMPLFTGFHESAPVATGAAPLAPLASAGMFAACLRADLSARSWRRILDVCAGTTEDCGTLLCPSRIQPGTRFLFYNRRKLAGMQQREVPKVTVLDLTTGGRAVLAAGLETPFDVLLWQSRIPPYVAYVTTCEIHRARQEVVPDGQRIRKRRRVQLPPEGGMTMTHTKI